MGFFKKDKESKNEKSDNGELKADGVASSSEIEMTIDSIRVSLGNYQRVVILKEKEGERFLPCWIGPTEADSIAVKLQGVSVPRPLTHDFTCTVINALGGSAICAVINKLENDTFYAKMRLECDGGIIEVDCRPSDAIAVAVRENVAIFAEEKVLEKAGVLIDPETGNPFESSSEEVPPSTEPAKERISAFSESVQSILSIAENEAERVNCSYVCTGHLLSALLSGTNIATEVIKSAGSDPAKIRLDIETLLKGNTEIEGGGIGLTPSVKEVIQTSIAEAKRLGADKVLPEHLLLGIMGTSDGIAANQLKNAGINQEMIYAELIRLYNRSQTGLSGE